MFEQDENRQTDKRRKVDSDDQSRQQVAATAASAAPAAPASQDLSISDDTIVGHYMDCSENTIINDGDHTE